MELSYFAAGVLDTAVRPDTRRTFASFDSFAAWLEAMEPAVSGVPYVDPPNATATDEALRSFKAALHPKKTRCPMFSPFTFAVGTKRRDLAENMHLLVLETDGDFGGSKSDAVRRAALLLGWGGVEYSTFSHRSARPCLRFIFEISRPVSAVRTDGRSDADHMRAAAIAKLGSEHFDAHDVGLSYFVPSCPSWARSEAIFDRLPGRAIDVDALLREPVQLAARARDFSEPARTRPVTMDDLAAFIAAHEKRVVRGTDPKSPRRLEIARAIYAGLELPGPHRDTALNSWYRSFRYWFDDRYPGHAPCPRSMAALCIRTHHATSGLSRPPVEDTYASWNSGHDLEMTDKRKLRTERAEAALAEGIRWSRELPLVPSAPAISPAELRRQLGLP